MSNKARCTDLDHWRSAKLRSLAWWTSAVAEKGTIAYSGTHQVELAYDDALDTKIQKIQDGCFDNGSLGVPDL